jgi:hypothetical protein
MLRSAYGVTFDLGRAGFATGGLAQVSVEPHPGPFLFNDYERKCLNHFSHVCRHGSTSSWGPSAVGPEAVWAFYCPGRGRALQTLAKIIVYGREILLALPR